MYDMATKIYTKTGDDGSTGMLFGGRVSKADVLIDSVGDVDETVALIGVARASCDDAELADLLLKIQRELFVVGADLATHPERRRRLVDGVSKVTPEMVAGLEETMDALVAESPLRPVFIVPGATVLGASLDHARTVARRAERKVVAAQESGHTVAEEAAVYLNRISDLLFVLARRAANEVDEPVSHEGHPGSSR